MCCFTAGGKLLGAMCARPSSHVQHLRRRCEEPTPPCGRLGWLWTRCSLVGVRQRVRSTERWQRRRGGGLELKRRANGRRSLLPCSCSLEVSDLLRLFAAPVTPTKLVLIGFGALLLSDIDDIRSPEVGRCLGWEASSNSCLFVEGHRRLY